MAVTFAYRSDTQSTAHYSRGANEVHQFGNLNRLLYQTNTSAIGGFAWDAVQAGPIGLSWSGNLNFPSTSTVSMMMRISPQYSSSAVEGKRAIWGFSDNFGFSDFALNHDNSGYLLARFDDRTGATLVNATFATAALDPTTTSWFDVVVTFNNATTGAGSIQAYIDGVSAGGLAFSNVWSSASDNIKSMHSTVNMLTGNGHASINEIVIWDEIIDPTSVNLISTGGTTSTAQSLNGDSRTGWVDVQAAAGLTWTSLTAAQIQNGVSQIQAGLTQTGSFTGEVWSTITAAQILSGVNQIQNGTTITGTLNTPTAVAGTSTTINIPNIKEQIRFVLNENNTTTSSVLDLSAGMNSRVSRVLKVNPENIRLDQENIPYVTVYTDSKSVEATSMAKNQVSGKREAQLNFMLVGCVYNPNFEGDIFDDPADNDLERLMENTEKILRHYATLDANVKWQIPTTITYHNASFDEETHLRIGFLTLQAVLLY